MKYSICILIWVLFLVLLSFLRVVLVLKFLPYILMVTFFALVVGTFLIVFDGKKKGKNNERFEQKNY